MSGFDYVNDSMLEMYLFETSTLLEQLDEILLQSEKNEGLTSENVDEIFRIMHTIKGSSSMMEFDIISYVSHKLEDLFFVIRENGVPECFFISLMDLVLKVSDFLKAEVEKLQLNQDLSVENDELIAETAAFLEQLKEGDLFRNASDKSQDESGEYFIRFGFAQDCQMENVRALMLINRLNAIGQVVETIPADLDSGEDVSISIATNGFHCRLHSSFSEDEIQNAVQGTLSLVSCSFLDGFPSEDKNQKDSDQSPVLQISTPESAVEDKFDSARNLNKSNAPKQNLINVDLNKLDALMDLVGEIVITESMVTGNADKTGMNLDNFSKASRQLRKLTDELQDIVMSIRMVPIASTFQKMRRIVRDMSKKLSKEVDLVLAGESTEVDKTIIDGIADPLMHLVRNAMDHGLEDKNARVKSNKNPVGQIILSAESAGGDIIISVRDDGRGLDPKMILEKARSKQLLTKSESEMTEREIFNLLTLPGFSTKDTVTEYSGRGVGMDVVKKNIEKIGGTVTIDSVKGSGTTIYFKIPLTLAIIESMEIKVGGTTYTVPISNIRESFKASSKQLIRDPDGNEMIMIRGVCYPIIRLHKLYHIEKSITKIEDGILLLIDSGENLACILADELAGKHQVVVKPLPTYLNRFGVKGSGIAGCTILGDGSISLILDAQGILHQH